jgi:putative oxidoreductase
MKGNNPGIALLLLRLIVGVVFLNHGLGKLIGPPFAGAGMDGWIGFVTQIGLPSPVGLAWVWVVIETLGGLALILGAGTGVAGLLLAVGMAVAIVKVHLPHGFDVFRYGSLDARGYEYSLTLLVASLAIAVGGPGVLALRLKQGD